MNHRDALLVASISLAAAQYATTIGNHQAAATLLGAWEGVFTGDDAEHARLAQRSEPARRVVVSAATDHLGAETAAAVRGEGAAMPWPAVVRGIDALTEGAT